MMQELFLYNPITSYILIIMTGLITGSFLNVVIYRLPLILKAEWLAEANELLQKKGRKKSNINLFLPLSFCPSCNTPVKPQHNIPVVSYLWLKARCPHCHHAISFRYPFIELLTAGLFALAAWHFGLTVQMLFAWIFISFIICLFFIDLEHQLLPDSLTLTLLWIGLIANTQTLFTSLDNAVLSAACGWLSLWLFIRIYYLLTGKIGMGHGDFKLFAALGAWFGWMYLPFIILLACLFGSILGIVILKWLKKPADTPIPFGPFLCFSGLIVLFWGENIISMVF